jgi:molybdate transport system substrate-binding protein
VTTRSLLPTLFGLALVATGANAAELTVSAASSLSNAFAELGRAYESTRPQDKVELNFAASDVLLRQIEHGAPADVFASADEATMDAAAARGLLDTATRRDFAGNALVVIVAAGVAAPTSLGALSAAAYPRIAIGNPDSVPAGRYARQALIRDGLWQSLQAQVVPTQNVRQALDYVARGEAQAGFVYATDAAIRRDKVRVALTVALSPPVRYPIAAVAHSAHAEAARRFIDFIVSAPAQAVLARYGFTRAAP